MIQKRDVNCDLGVMIGKGAEKKCYLNRNDPSRCLKLSKIGKSVQIRREIDYLYLLKKKNLSLSFVPKFYEGFRTSMYIGCEQECFLSKERGGICEFVISLSDYIEKGYGEIDQIKELLNSLKKEMLDNNVICCDLHGGNVLVVKKEQEPLKLVVIDGFGAPEFIPICKYIKWFGRIKIERQWKKFEKRIKMCFDVREKLKC